MKMIRQGRTQDATVNPTHMMSTLKLNTQETALPTTSKIMANSLISTYYNYYYYNSSQKLGVNFSKE